MEESRRRALLIEGRDAFNRGEYYEAHEHWEDVWNEIDDPERTWAQIGDYLLYEAQTYASYQTPGQHSTPMVDASTVDDLKASAQIVVGTPDQVVEIAATIPPMGALTFNPLAGGLPPALAWESLELFASEVHPRLKAAG